MLYRILRLLTGLAVLPFSGAAVVGLFLTLYGLPGFGESGYWLLAGMAAYVLLSLVLPRPVILYVVGHELTHALWSKLFGGRVSNLKVSRKGGSVRVSAVNTLVILAPYFFPLYTIVVGAGFVLLGLFINVSAYYNVLLFLIGFTLQFHYLTTSEALGNSQPDFYEAGIVFSLALIPLLNVLVLALVFQAVFLDMEIVIPMIKTTFLLAGMAYLWLGKWAVLGVKWLIGRWNG